MGDWQWWWIVVINIRNLLFRVVKNFPSQKKKTRIMKQPNYKNANEILGRKFSMHILLVWSN